MCIRDRLTAELTARRKQYEYYRDLLLTFGDEVEWKTLDEIARYAKSRIEAREVNADTYVGVDNLLPDKMGKTTSNYVPLEGRLIKYDIGDILIGNIRPYLKKIWLATDAGGTNGDVLVIRINDRKAVLPKYLYFVLSSDNFFVYNMQNAKEMCIRDRLKRGSRLWKTTEKNRNGQNYTAPYGILQMI